MINFFDQQLLKLARDAKLAKDTELASGDIKFLGRAAFLKLDSKRRARIEFETLDVSDCYEAVRVTILNKREGKIDSQRFRFGDYFSANSRGAKPHIWIDRGAPEWYIHPAAAEWQALAEAVREYISLYE